jgi:hypothetical protein
VRKSLVVAGFATIAIQAAMICTTVTPVGASTVAAGNVTGTVVDASTASPLAGICVNVVDATNNQTVGTSAATGKKGVWKVTGIPPSTSYTALAFDCRKSGNYVAQWYDGQDFQPQATQFTVAAGKATRQIDFSLSLGGAISGKVTDSGTNGPVQGILVIAFWTTAEQASTFAQCTSSTGSYKLQGVPTSGAKIEFLPNDCGVSSSYGSVWYENQSNYGSATVVSVTADLITKHINQQVTASTTGS